MGMWMKACFTVARERSFRAGKGMQMEMDVSDSLTQVGRSAERGFTRKLWAVRFEERTWKSF